MKCRALAIAVAGIVLSGLGAAAAQATTLHVWGTSDIVDSNLLTSQILPEFAVSNPSDTIDYHSVGSGAAIAQAEASGNNVDAILVHSPALEAPFVSGGFSQEPLGRALFYNDYVVVGPTGDPAGVATNDRHDAVGAFEAIAAAGALSTPTATFLSRNDNSGTNVQEQTMWGQTTTLTKQLAANRPTGNTTRYQPGSGGSFPGWYKFTNTTQGANLIDANNCNATGYPANSCYTLVDRGTYLYQKSITSPWHLKIVSDANASSARGGAGELANPFHGYIVKNAANAAIATKLLDDLTTANSAGFQLNKLPAFPGSGNVSFIGDAFENISSSSIPASATAGSVITISATLQYPPPVAQPVAGLSVQLQSSTDGVHYSDVSGSVATTSSAGLVTFTPTFGSASTYYQLKMGTYDDTALASRFSANTNSSLGPNKDGYVPLH